MNKGSIEQKHFSILCCFAEICKENEIPYVLAEHSAWDAVKFQRYHDKMWETAVMVSDDAWTKLSSLKLDSTYVLYHESPEARSAWFFDKSTTLIDYRDLKRYPLPACGLKIIIAKSTTDEAFSVMRPNGTHFSLTKSELESVSSCILEKTKFPILADIDNYFTLLVSPDWRKKKWPFRIPKRNLEVVFLPNFPFECFTNRPLVKKSLNKWSRLKRKLYWKWRKKKYTPMLKKITKYQSFLSLTEDRFDLWDQYFPKKQYLIQLANNDPLSPELEELLNPYIEKVIKYKKKKMGLYFDQEIYEISLPILEERCGKEFVSAYQNLIPKQHKDKSLESIILQHSK